MALPTNLTPERSLMHESLIQAMTPGREFWSDTPFCKMVYSVQSANCFHLTHIIAAVRITSWYPKFYGSHFGLPPMQPSAKWPDWVAKWCGWWRIRTGPITTYAHGRHTSFILWPTNAVEPTTEWLGQCMLSLIHPLGQRGWTHHLRPVQLPPPQIITTKRSANLCFKFALSRVNWTI